MGFEGGGAVGVAVVMEAAWRFVVWKMIWEGVEETLLKLVGQERCSAGVAVDPR